MGKSAISRGFQDVRPWRKWLILALRVMLAVASMRIAAVDSAVAQEHNEGDLGPGCRPDRAVIAHRAGGITTQAPQGSEAPIPCVTRIGAHAGEISIVVTKTGTVLFRPAWDANSRAPAVGLMRTTDRGANWDTPNSPYNDTNMWADQDTGRVFWMSCGGRCAHPLFDISDDDGKSWYPGGRPLTGPAPAFFGGGGTGGYDHVELFGGPPTASLKSLMKGYPNVLYACMGHYPLKCQKSLDGGMTWGPELDIPYPPELEAIQGPAHDCSAFGQQGVVDKDGTVYVPYGPCNRPYVAISHDEGASWQLVAVANTDLLFAATFSLGMDQQENLYAAWVGASNRLPYLAISRDHGMHWGAPLMIGAPGVNESALTQLVAGAKGQVAITYYASKNAPIPFPPPCFTFPAGPIQRLRSRFSSVKQGDELMCAGYENEKWDTYVTESWNALDQQPLFWSATLNEPAQPTWYGCSPSYVGVLRWDESFNTGPGFSGGCTPPGFPFDYYGAAMGTDGTVWIGFAQECSVGMPPGNPNCPDTRTGIGGLFGLLGRFIQRGQHGSSEQKIIDRPGAPRVVQNVKSAKQE